ncbi:MAG: hypothetical protein IJ823_06420 [Bacteroidales bacterium]|nr:hypothetical protein [Bacteroidales bacterium]
MILQNLKSLIRRYPVAVVLNFTGLVAALLAFALIFLQALVIVGLLCAIVVLYHYLKTARMNPAETLKNE